MKRLTLLVITLASLVACAGGGTRNDNYAEDAELQVAYEQTSIACVGQKSCESIWQRTRDYIVQHSTTPIRRADNDVIETKEPHQFGVLYIWASKTSMSGDRVSSTIKIKVMCRGMYESDGSRGWMYGTCAGQVAQVERGFRHFVADDD
ncbi:hypothetical protein LJR029_000883 [Caballeronia sp. LjRoot29]|uniref:hypothetical protein n=1 Tax=unclassified Caballeronia TaxID=2646786 RepID=UPI003ECD908B